MAHRQYIFLTFFVLLEPKKITFPLLIIFFLFFITLGNTLLHLRKAVSRPDNGGTRKMILPDPISQEKIILSGASRYSDLDESAIACEDIFISTQNSFYPLGPSHAIPLLQ